MGVFHSISSVVDHLVTVHQQFWSKQPLRYFCVLQCPKNHQLVSCHKVNINALDAVTLTYVTASRYFHIKNEFLLNCNIVHKCTQI